MITIGPASSPTNLSLVWDSSLVVVSFQPPGDGGFIVGVWCLHLGMVISFGYGVVFSFGYGHFIWVWCSLFIWVW